MSYKRKTEPGRQLHFFEAVEDIYHGYYIYLNHKPMHPGYMYSMSLWTIRNYCLQGKVRQCLSKKTGRPYKAYRYDNDLTDSQIEYGERVG